MLRGKALRISQDLNTFMGKALFSVLTLCLYITDNDISFGEVLWFGLVL